MTDRSFHDSLLERVEDFAAALDDEAAGADRPELDEFAVRRLLLTIRDDKNEVQRLKRLLDGIVVPYRERITVLEARVERARGWLRDYVREHGRVSFPDAGSVHLTTKAARWKVAGKYATLDDAPAALRDLLEPETSYVLPADALAKLDDLLTVAPDGAVVAKETGEVVEGVEYVPETQTPVVTL